MEFLETERFHHEQLVSGKLGKFSNQEAIGGLGLTPSRNKQALQNKLSYSVWDVYFSLSEIMLDGWMDGWIDERMNENFHKL